MSMSDGASRVLDVGNCDPDHRGIRELLERHFDVTVDRAMFVDEAMAQLGRQRYDLVLVNRIIFDDDSDGSELIRRMRHNGHRTTPIMLISNYADAQERAVADGAVPGFGKAALHDPATVQLLTRHLRPK